MAVVTVTRESDDNHEGRAAWRIELGDQSILAHLTPEERNQFASELEEHGQKLVEAIAERDRVLAEKNEAADAARQELRRWIAAHPLLNPVPEPVSETEEVESDVYIDKDGVRWRRTSVAEDGTKIGVVEPEASEGKQALGEPEK